MTIIWQRCKRRSVQLVEAVEASGRYLPRHDTLARKHQSMCVVDLDQRTQKVLLRLAKIYRENGLRVDRSGKTGAVGYQSSRTPNCTIRPSRSVETGANVGLAVIKPVEEFTVAVVLIVVTFGWLKMLFASMKNFG